MSSIELRNKTENTSPAGTEWIYSQDAGSPYTVKKIELDTIANYVLSLVGGNPTGTVIESAALTAPTGYYAADGSAKSRTTDANLYNAITADKGAVTITIASPGVVTLNSHGLETGNCIELTTTGALPTGLSANTNYYVIYNDANSFWLATSLANALAGTKINTSGTQSGTHNLRFCPYGISGASDFLLPNRKAVVGKGAGSQTINGRAKSIGLGEVQEDQMQRITGSFQGGGLFADIVAQGFTGAFSQGTSTSLTISTSASANTEQKVGFDSANSPDARTSATTAGATRENAIGMNYYIKY